MNSKVLLIHQVFCISKLIFYFDLLCHLPLCNRTQVRRPQASREEFNILTKHRGANSLYLLENRIIAFRK